MLDAAFLPPGLADSGHALPSPVRSLAAPASLFGAEEGFDVFRMLN